MDFFSKNMKLLAGILFAVTLLPVSSQVSSWAAVAAQPGYSIILLNGDLAGPDELDFNSAGNIFVANAGAPNVFEHEDFISKLTPTGVPISREFIDNLEGSSGVAVDENGNIYVSQDVEEPIRKYDPTGTLIFKFQPHRPAFSDPDSITLTQDGRLLAPVQDISQANQWRILAFDIQTGLRLQDFTPPFEFVYVNSVVYKDGQLFIGGANAPGKPGPVLIAEEGQAPIAYAYNNQLATGYVNGIALGTDGTLFVTENTRLRKVSADGSVTVMATGFVYARGLAEKDECIFVADFRDGIEGALYLTCHKADFDTDGDVDGKDLAAFIANPTGFSLAAIAASFGT
jgi:sugar lactone lactonase YvrE